MIVFRRPSPWTVLSIIVLLVVLVPLGVIFSSFVHGFSDVWQHLAHTILAEITLNTFWLVLGVGCFAFVLGVTLAGLMVFCEFPGRKILEWAMILPFAIPTYVLGFVWIGLLDYSAVLPTILREQFGINILTLFSIRSRGGVIFVMTLALYPYVYLLARNAFMTQGRSVWEAAASLGLTSKKIFWKVSIPMAKPWILGGVMLVSMETLADFGTVSVFNYDTFTTGIYKAWFGLFSVTAAAQLSSVLLIIVFVVLMLEYILRGRCQSFASASRHNLVLRRIGLKRGWSFLAFVYPVMVLLLGFIIPVVQLIIWSIEAFGDSLDPRYFTFIFNTLILSGMAAMLACFVSLGLSYSSRRHPGKGMSFVTQAATLGYAVPGTILAVGVFLTFKWIDRRIGDVLGFFTDGDPGSILTGSIAAMIIAYLIRFLAVSYKPVDSAMHRITRNIEEAGRNLGIRGISLIRKVHIPMIKGGMTAAFLLVFVDVMKEMPITLMTRPFGWDTLAVRIFEMTAEGQWEQAAFPSVILIGVGLIPVLYLVGKNESKLRI